MSKIRCYKVTVRTTNGLCNTTSNWHGFDDMKLKIIREKGQKEEYHDCEHGILYVIADDPRKIYDKFGQNTVEEITDVGFGYCLIEHLATKG